MYSRAYNDTEQAWSTWERELNGVREALAATQHLTKGHVVHLFTDHRNNLFTDSLFNPKRINKKLLRWALECEELGVGSRVVRH